MNRPETPEGWQVWDLVGRLGGAVDYHRRVPLDALDYDRLAQLNVPGGSIRNIALGAPISASEATT